MGREPRHPCPVLALRRHSPGAMLGRLPRAVPEVANQGGCEPGIWTYFRGTRSQWTRVRYRWLRAQDLNLRTVQRHRAENGHVGECLQRHCLTNGPEPLLSSGWKQSPLVI
jgi:hypothetical protein